MVFILIMKNFVYFYITINQYLISVLNKTNKMNNKLNNNIYMIIFEYLLDF